MEKYFENNLLVFYVLTFSVSTIPVPGLVAALLHAIKGNKNKVPILVTLGAIVSWLSYGAFMYEFYIGK
jgi:hypothetical protein